MFQEFPKMLYRKNGDATETAVVNDAAEQQAQGEEWGEASDFFGFATPVEEVSPKKRARKEK